MKQLDYSLLFRWFVGLSMNEPVWHPTAFTKNRDRLLEGEIASAFFEQVLGQARRKHLPSSEHFIMTENRNGLIVNARLTLATGLGERAAAVAGLSR